MVKAKAHQKSYESFVVSRPNDNRRWDGSEAQKLLRQMVKTRSIEGLTMEQIRTSNDLFQIYTKEKFHNHLSHEKKRHWKHQNPDDYKIGRAHV